MIGAEPAEAAVSHTLKSMSQLRLEDNGDGNNSIVKEFNKDPFKTYKVEQLGKYPDKKQQEQPF